MIEDDDSRLLWFDTDIFAEPATITPPAGDPFDLNVIFDLAPVNTQNFENRFPQHHGAQPSGSGPMFRCRDVDFPKAWAANKTVSVVLRGVAHAVFDVEHDGHGMAFVKIKRKIDQ